MMHRVLVANRGEIARRIVAGVHATGLQAIAVHEAHDSDSPYVAAADQAVALPSDGPRPAYADPQLLLDAARATRATAVHPGYGFLSENDGFATAVLDAGLVWIGPSPQAIRATGDKVEAKRLARAAQVPVLPGSVDPVVDISQATPTAATIGYPLIIKASAGGGGMGMEIVETADGLAEAFARAQGRAERLFGDPTMLLERYVRRARHIEVQLLGLRDGRVVTLGERECSVQRRHQKLVEESPSPFVGPELRRALSSATARFAESIDYRNAGTVEFVVDGATGEFFFLEMNTRLQVEHPVTEAVTGIDLVAAQLSIALDLPLRFDPDAVEHTGHAIELRVCAEDPVRFLPNPGTIETWREPAGVRVDSGYRSGNVVSPRYDSLLAKVVVHGATRDAAIARAVPAADAFEITGIKTNLPFHSRVLADPVFRSGDYSTDIVSNLMATRPG